MGCKCDDYITVSISSSLVIDHYEHTIYCCGSETFNEETNDLLIAIFIMNSNFCEIRLAYIYDLCCGVYEAIAMNQNALRKLSFQWCLGTYDLRLFKQIILQNSSLDHIGVINSFLMSCEQHFAMMAIANYTTELDLSTVSSSIVNKENLIEILKTNPQMSLITIRQSFPSLKDVLKFVLHSGHIVQFKFNN
jgi:hypothetical protein